MTAGFQPRYQLGLSLSGAISAGAYSAGVLDFLLQALDCWEKAAGGENVPVPAVGLKVLSGASAGAITAAVGAIALAGDPESAAFPGAVADGTQPLQYYFRRLYETWVVKPALVADDGGPDLLSTTDLEGPDVFSVLNSDLLDKIAEAALAFSEAQASKTAPRSYVSSRLHIYLTLANLRGTPYYVKFTGGDYGMMQHGDRSHYVLTGLGAWPTTSDFADDDAPSYELDAADLLAGGTVGWASYGNAALASAAFPVGLKPREVETNVAAYQGRGWPVADWQTLQTVTPRFDEPWLMNHQKGTFTFTAVDGGVINNDPFEYALYSLPDKQDGSAPQPLKEETRPQHVDRGVIMIAPFPEQPTFPPDGVPGLGLIPAYMALMPALKQQVRFKPAAFALAGDDNVGSRFMISPSRQLEGGEVDARFPISSGLLGGFGGFVARSFRDHDFQLGRRNCQQFLKTAFVLPPTNHVIQASYAAVGPAGGTADASTDAVMERQVIPLFGDAACEVKNMAWPRITQGELDHILQRLGIRLRKVAAKLLSTRQGQPLLKLATPLTAFIPGLLHRTILRTFLADLVKRDQIAEWVLPADWAGSFHNADEKRAYEQDTRALIGALLTPAFDMRTVDGLTMTCDIDKARVQAILAQCSRAAGKPYQVWLSDWFDQQDSRLVCLLSDRPGWLKRQCGKNHAGSLFFALKIDPPVPKPPLNAVVAA